MNTKWILYGLFFSLLSVSVKAADNRVGIALYESGMTGAAKVFFLDNLPTLTDNVGQAEACYYLGECYLTLGQRDSAGFYYDKGVGLQPDYPYNRVGQASLKLNDDPSGAEALLKDALGTKGYKKDATLQIAIARAYLHAGDAAKAMEHVNKAKELDDKSGLPYLVEGDILVMRGHTGDACAKYESATYFSPDCLGAYLKQAQILKGCAATKGYRARRPGTGRWRPCARCAFPAPSGGWMLTRTRCPEIVRRRQRIILSLSVRGITTRRICFVTRGYCISTSNMPGCCPCWNRC